MKFRILALQVSILLAVVGCGGSSGGDSPSNEQQAGSGNTIAPVETVDTGDTATPVETVDTGDTATPVETVDTGDTATPVETVDTGDTATPVETVDTGDTATPVDTVDTGDTNPSATVVQPVTGPQPAIDSIENLFGQVTFQYQVPGSSNVAETSVVFTALDEVAPFDDDRSVLVISETLDLFSCRELSDVGNRDFLCGSLGFFDGINQLFVFSMDSQLTGSGEFVVCAAEVSNEDCAGLLAQSPDGAVNVTITRNTVAASKVDRLNGELISNTELRDYVKADELEFGGSNSVSNLDEKLVQGFVDTLRSSMLSIR